MQNWSSKEELFPGVWVYRNVSGLDMNLIQRLENLVEESKGKVEWKEAMVGYMEKKPEYRDCQDIKVGPIEKPENIIQEKYNEIWKDSKALHSPAVQDYLAKYSIRMDYWEVMNFISYGPEQHFQEHADHGFSYSATVSLVAYPNDDYEGGELTFPKLNLKIKPKAGDLYIFPSTYLFSHRAEKVSSGKKYSIVTMLDYNDNAHNNDYMQLVQKRNNEQFPSIQY
jgi:hypothetical protein